MTNHVRHEDTIVRLGGLLLVLLESRRLIGRSLFCVSTKDAHLADEVVSTTAEGKVQRDRWSQRMRNEKTEQRK